MLSIRIRYVTVLGVSYIIGFTHDYIQLVLKIASVALSKRLTIIMVIKEENHRPIDIFGSQNGTGLPVVPFLFGPADVQVDRV